MISEKSKELFSSGGRNFRIRKSGGLGEKETFNTFEEYRQDILNRAQGHQKLYKKKIDLTEDEKQQAEYVKSEKDFIQGVKDYMNPDNLELDPLNVQRTEKTKSILRSIRLNNAFDFVREKNNTTLNAEYGNYSKYKRNFTNFKESKLKEEYDPGFFDAKRRLKTYLNAIAPDTMVNDPRSDVLKAQELEAKNITVNEDLYEDAASELYDPSTPATDEKEMNDKVAEAEYGRLSPHAKEKIYQLYKQGWPISDLSHKYGILPDRCKAVI